MICKNTRFRIKHFWPQLSRATGPQARDVSCLSLHAICVKCGDENTDFIGSGKDQAGLWICKCFGNPDAGFKFQFPLPTLLSCPMSRLMLKHLIAGGGRGQQVWWTSALDGKSFLFWLWMVMHSLDQSCSLLTGLHKCIIIPGKVMSEVTIRGVTVVPTSWRCGAGPCGLPCCPPSTCLWSVEKL